MPPRIMILSMVAGLLAMGTPAPADLLPTAVRFEHITVDDGLPDPSVRGMIQDRWGFLWFATQNGLVRYDGRSFTPVGPYNPATEEYATLACLSVFEDRDGFIWIGTFATGVWRLDPATGEFEHWNLDGPPERHLGGLQVDSIDQAPDGTIWIATGDGILTAIDPVDGGTRPLAREAGAPLTSAPPDTALTKVLVDRAGRLWVASEGKGVAYRNPGSQRWRHLRHDRDDPGTLPSDVVPDIHEDDRGRIWVATRQGLGRWDPASDRFARYMPVPEQPSSMVNYTVRIDHDQQDRLWVGAALGLLVFDPDTGEFQHFDNDPQRDDALLHGPVLSILCDSAGIIWGGTWHAGLNKLDPTAHQFHTDRHDPDDPRSLDLDMIQNAFEDSRGVLWVGTGDRTSGLSRGGLNSRLPGETAFRRHRFPPDDPLQPGTIYSFAEDSDGVLWIGTDAGLWILPPNTSIPRRLPGLSTPGAPLHTGPVQAVTIDGQGHVWIGGYSRGLYQYDPTTRDLRRYVAVADDPSTLAHNNVHGIHRDRRGRVWISMDTRGMAYYDRETDSFVRLFDPESGLASPMSIAETDEDGIWVASFAGLLRLDEDGKVIEKISSRDGLPNDLIGSLAADDQGRLWMSTGRGFARYDPASGEIRSFDTSDGLPTNEVCYARCRARDGRMYFCSREGLISFDPDLMQNSPFIPPVVITELRLADEVVRPGGDSPLSLPIERTTELTLAHDQNDLSLAFAALHFARPDRNRYRYMLEGVDPDWRDPGQDRRAFYTSLSPGRYTFRVRGSNADGVWNPEEAFLDIHVRPPWWRTTWATTFYVLLGIGFIGLVYRQLIQRERMRTALEVERAEARQWQELDRLRSRFFANVSHEFRTPLTLLRSPLRRLEDDPTTGDRELFRMMNRNAGRLGQLIDQLLDLSRLEAGRLPLQWRCDDVVSFLRELATRFSPLSEERNIDLQIVMPDLAATLWFDADLLEKVAGNLISNAIKYTPDGGRIRVEVSMTATAQQRAVPRAPADEGQPATAPARELSLAVANTGSYIPPDERKAVFERFHQLAGAGEAGGTGIGLALVKELVALQGGTIDLESDPEAGTCFTASLPVFEEAPPGALHVPARRRRDPDGTVETDSYDEDESADTTPDIPRLLVVEDSADLRQYLARELAPHYEVLLAADGTEGLARAQDEIPDLVVSDVMMPGIDGFELCRRLKSDWRTSHVPVVLLTAKAGVESRLTGLELGADDYLAKPFDARELLARIANLIALRRALQERYASQIQSVQPEALPVVSMDDRFLARCREIIDENLDDADLSVEIYAREVGLSRAQLHRKLKALTNLSPGEFIRTHRLQRAADLLAGRYGNVTEVSYSTGFKNPSHFARCFRDQYGVAPSAYKGADSPISDDPTS